MNLQPITPFRLTVNNKTKSTIDNDIDMLNLSRKRKGVNILTRDIANRFAHPREVCEIYIREGKCYAQKLSMLRTQKLF
jgi:hypothetical protein